MSKKEKLIEAFKKILAIFMLWFYLIFWIVGYSVDVLGIASGEYSSFVFFGWERVC